MKLYVQKHLTEAALIEYLIKMLSTYLIVLYFMKIKSCQAVQIGKIEILEKVYLNLFPGCIESFNKK